MENHVRGYSLFSQQDIYLFKEGSLFKIYELLGSHQVKHEDKDGVYFAVWAPNAKHVSVIGDFNYWDKWTHPLNLRGDSSGIWEGFIPYLKKGDTYKYFISSNHNNYSAEKADPFAFHCETPQKTGSKVWDLDYKWNDDKWMKTRYKNNSHKAPMSIYEMHLGSWRRKPEDNNRMLSYREIADQLKDYCLEMNFTHIELMPVMEHPFYASWGYQTTGYFAPTSRYGTPQDLMYMIDVLHQAGIGVIMDWVPSHFPTDLHGLAFFDGTHLYEHADQRQGFHPDWKSAIFNYGRNEVKNFLISSALFWLDKYHIDGIRVDAVASMLYLDYSRKDGEWLPNKYGGKENIEAIEFLKRLNHVVYENHNDVQMIAEESTAWPMVSKPTYLGGLGFGFKWNMGWMNDTLRYFKTDPVFRKYNHTNLTFSLLYAFSEQFMLPFSHDEVTQGKGSLVGKMPGDEWQRFANLRLLIGYMYGHPGKKLLFMGSEFGQVREWMHDESLEWHVLQFWQHSGMQNWVKDVNKVYKQEKALFEDDNSWAGFEWVDCNDTDNSVLSFLRKSPSTGDVILCIYNFNPVPKHNYKVGVTNGGYWYEILNSDSDNYFGSNLGNLGGVNAYEYYTHAKPYTLEITLPPLSAVFFKHKG
ncbi:1,4-alpha-glucan branching protein GlgB [Elusimicrobiota bacterium]